MVQHGKQLVFCIQMFHFEYIYFGLTVEPWEEYEWLVSTVLFSHPPVTLHPVTSNYQTYNIQPYYLPLIIEEDVIKYFLVVVKDVFTLPNLRQYESIKAFVLCSLLFPHGSEPIDWYILSNNNMWYKADRPWRKYQLLLLHYYLIPHHSQF